MTQVKWVFSGEGWTFQKLSKSWHGRGLTSQIPQPTCYWNLTRVWPMPRFFWWIWYSVQRPKEWSLNCLLSVLWGFYECSLWMFSWVFWALSVFCLFSACSLSVLLGFSKCSLRNDKKSQVSKTGKEINLSYRRLHRTQCASQSCRLDQKQKHLNRAKEDK